MWNRIKNVVPLILAFLISVTFFVSGIIINMLQAPLYYFLRPFNKYAYRKINYYLEYSLYSQLVFMGEWWSGSDVLIYIDKDDFKKYYGKEHAYLVMNHRYDVDWLIGWMFCDRIGVLGNCKAYAKKSLQYLPAIGFAWKFAESVFLERSWEKDKEAIATQISELVEYPDPIWLLLYAEGTRFTKEKHEASLAFAREKGLKELKHHLTPRTRGFTASLPKMRGKLNAIYNVQLAFKEKTNVQTTVTAMLHGTPLEGHLFIERIDLKEVPEDDEGAAEFLRNLYIKKDQMMESFLKTGDWFAESDVKRVEPFKLPRRIYSLLNTFGWSIAILLPLGYFFLQLLMYGSMLSISIGLFIIAVVFIMLFKLIDQTKISKGSSYGKTTPTSPTTPTNAENSFNTSNGKSDKN